MRYDIAIVGAGVTGAMIARQLSKYDLNIILIEKENDCAMGATKANSAICHAGFDAREGTLKAKLNVEGCRLMPEVCRELNVPFKQCGSLVVALSEAELDTLQQLYDRGIANQVPDMKILNKTELLQLESKINPEATGALYAQTAGILCPYELTIASVENAITNGVEFLRNAQVIDISSQNEGFTINTTSGDIEAHYIINAAGVYADRLASMIGDDSFEIIPRRGEYFLLDRSVGNTVSHVIFQCPGPMGKGLLVTPTVDGNLLLGPTSEDIDDKDDVATTARGLAKVKELSVRSVPSVSARNAITSFSGLRAHGNTGDFVIDYSKASDRFINVACIESPGLSAAPAIAVYVEELLKSSLTLKLKTSYTMQRKAPIKFRELSNDEREALIKENPKYGKIICRCETVTEGEIIDAIRAPGGARDVDGVKRRTRAGMGRCQGGFCGSKVVDILARELGKDINEITKFGKDSAILYDKTK